MATTRSGVRNFSLLHSVGKKPGRNAFTRTPNAAHSRARFCKASEQRALVQAAQDWTGRLDVFVILLCYCGKTPQSTLMHCPVIAEAAGDARKRHTLATSSSVGRVPRAEFDFAKLCRYAPTFLPDGGASSLASACRRPSVSTYTGRLHLRT